MSPYRKATGPKGVKNETLPAHIQDLMLNFDSFRTALKTHFLAVLRHHHNHKYYYHRHHYHQEGPGLRLEG